MHHGKLRQGISCVAGLTWGVSNIILVGCRTLRRFKVATCRPSSRISDATVHLVLVGSKTVLLTATENRSVKLYTTGLIQNSPLPAISNAELILEEIDTKWPVRNSGHSKEKLPASQ